MSRTNCHPDPCEECRSAPARFRTPERLRVCGPCRRKLEEERDG